MKKVKFLKDLEYGHLYTYTTYTTKSDKKFLGIKCFDHIIKTNRTGQKYVQISFFRLVHFNCKLIPICNIDKKIKVKDELDLSFFKKNPKKISQISVGTVCIEVPCNFMFEPINVVIVAPTLKDGSFWVADICDTCTDHDNTKIYDHGHFNKFSEKDFTGKYRINR